MAGVPCFSDTCSITSTVDSNGRAQLSARLDPTGGIVCGTEADENSGLRINLIGDPTPVSPASVSECDNLLGVTTEGSIFAQRPHYEILYLPAALVDFPASGANTAYSTNTTVTNNADCPRLWIARMKFQFNFTADNADPYESDGTFVADFGGSVNSYSFTVAGPALGPSGSDFKIHAIGGVEMGTIAAGASMVIRTYATRATDSDNSDGSGGSNGFFGSIGFTMLDLSPGDLF